MADATLTEWGFVTGEFQREELIRMIRRHKLTEAEEISLGYSIERYACRDLSEIKTGIQDHCYPTYVFGQVIRQDHYETLVSSMVTYIAEDFSYVVTISGSRYTLKGCDFIKGFKKRPDYDPEHE